MQILGGLLPELKALLDQGLQPDTEPLKPATRSIGYRQGLKWLHEVGKRRKATPQDIEELAATVQRRSRRLARRQMQFHQKLEYFHWVDAARGPEAAAAYIEGQLQLEEHRGARLLRALLAAELVA